MIFLSSFVAVKPWKYTRRYSTLFFIYLLQKKSKTKFTLVSPPLFSRQKTSPPFYISYLFQFFFSTKSSRMKVKQISGSPRLFLKGERSSYLVTIAVITRQVWANESLNVTDGSNRWSHVEPISLKWKPREEGVRGVTARSKIDWRRVTIMKYIYIDRY